MMKPHHILRCLPLLADALGRGYGVTVEIGGKDAFTTGKVIRLPSLPARADPTFLGLIRGYIDHESAHIRHTDFDALARENLTPLERNIWNILEDWRVEERLAAQFPGCGQNFRWLIGHLFLHQHTMPKSPAHRVVNWLLLEARSWSVPELDTRCQDEATLIDQDWPGLTDTVRAILATMRGHCPDTVACLDYARQVVRCLRDRPGFQHLLSATEADLPIDTGRLLQQALGQMAEQVGRCSVATVGEKFVFSLSGEELAEIARITAGLKARFHGLLQASRLVRSKPSRRGRLDPRRLHKIAFDDPSLFQAYGRKPALNTAIHILLDSSTSMEKDGRIGLATQCCAALAQALCQAGISIGITAFPGDPVSGSGPTVVPLLRHGERQHANLAVAAKGQTPLGEALWWALQRIIPLSEARKIVLILTDGIPDSVANATDAILAARAVGVEVFGLGINAPSIVGLLPGRSENLERLEDLPAAMFELLNRALLTGGKAA